MLTIRDFIDNNDQEIEIMIDGLNPEDDCDPWRPTYYEGKLKDIPEKLRNKEVMSRPARGA